MVRLNPFPDYPVIRLHDKAERIQELTIPTEAIKRSRQLANRYVEQWNIKKSNPDQKVEPLIVGVKGDYGTGKTHLLLDAAAQVQIGLFSNYPDIPILRISGLEADPIKWFKEAIGPELRHPFMQSIIVRLYAKAGQIVASEAVLTQAAGEKLKQEPWAIYALIRENLLSITSVDGEFETRLKYICPDVSEEVRNALAGLAKAETADISTRWLIGEDLNIEDLDKLHISKNKITDSDASGILVALATIHSYLDYPFAILIDELEHLTQYDRAHESKQNITWLKRLLEGLATSQIFILIAGHWSAWEAQSDYLDRFSQLKPIELVRLNGKDVLNVIKAYVEDLSPDVIDLPQAEVIAEFGDGNIRRILSICRVLFHESEGFSQPMDRERIRKLSEQIGQRISIEEAKLSVYEILKQQRLSVQQNATIDKGIQFDMIGYNAKQPKVLIDFRHAITQQDNLVDAMRFREQIKEVSMSIPNVIGCFISDGNVDEELLAIVKSDAKINILWFDLNQQDAIYKIATDLEAALLLDQEEDLYLSRLRELSSKGETLIKQIEAARSAENKEVIEQLQAQRAAIELEVANLKLRIINQDKTLEDQLVSLEEKLSRGLDQLHYRLEKLSNDAQSKREAEIISPRKEEVDVRLHTTYSDLTRQPSWYTRLHMGGFRLRMSLLIVLSCVAIFIFIIFIGGSLYEINFIRISYLDRTLIFFALL
jgi:hypothetical protein